MKTLLFIHYLIVGFCLCALPVRAEDIHAPKPAPENIQRILEENRYPAFVRECLAEAIPKLQKRAEAKEAILKKETIKVDGIDDRWYSPSKYVWFKAKIETPEGLEEITVMMQKPLRGKCF